MEALELNLICRVCLDKGSDLADIFDSQNDIAQLLMTCAPVKVFKNDGLPSRICKSCIERATMSSDFKRLCEESDLKLREYITGDVEVKQEPTVFLRDVTLLFDEQNPIDLFHSSSYEEKNNLYNCTICTAFCNSSKDLIDHVLNSHVTQPCKQTDVKYNCAICNRIYFNDFDLKRHQVTHREFKVDGEKNTCPLCKESFSRHNLLLKHIGYHLESSIHKCVHCCCYFTSNFRLEKHTERRHVKNLDNDKSPLTNKSDYLEKMDVKIEQDFSLDNCDGFMKNESSSSSVTVDLKELSDNSTMDTKLFSKQKRKRASVNLKKIKKEEKSDLNSINRTENLNEHKKRHSGEKSFLCSVCGKGYSKQSNLDKHLLTHTEDEVRNKMLECPVCGKIVNQSNHLRLHMRTHRNNNGTLLIPQSVDSNKKLILCSMCGKSCTSRSNLAVHMRRHLGVMTSICKICGKGYPRSTDLTLHMRRHTGEKPFICSLCGKSFARSDKLAIHMRIHTGEKPYSCQTCGRAFAQNNDLKAHKKRNNCQNQSHTRNENTTTIDSLPIYENSLAGLLKQNKAKNIKPSEENELLITAHTRAFELATAAVTSNLLVASANNLINTDGIVTARSVSDFVKQNFIVPEMISTQRNEFADYATALQNLSNYQATQFDMK